MQWSEPDRSEHPLVSRRQPRAPLDQSVGATPHRPRPTPRFPRSPRQRLRPPPYPPQPSCPSSGESPASSKRLAVFPGASRQVLRASPDFPETTPHFPEASPHFSELPATPGSSGSRHWPGRTALCLRLLLGGGHFRGSPVIAAVGEVAILPGGAAEGGADDPAEAQELSADRLRRLGAIALRLLQGAVGVNLIRVLPRCLVEQRAEVSHARKRAQRASANSPSHSPRAGSVTASPAATTALRSSKWALPVSPVAAGGHERRARRPVRKRASLFHLRCNRRDIAYDASEYAVCCQEVLPDTGCPPRDTRQADPKATRARRERDRPRRVDFCTTSGRWPRSGPRRVWRQRFYRPSPAPSAQLIDQVCRVPVGARLELARRGREGLVESQTLVFIEVVHVDRRELDLRTFRKHRRLVEYQATVLDPCLHDGVPYRGGRPEGKPAAAPCPYGRSCRCSVKMDRPGSRVQLDRCHAPPDPPQAPGSSAPPEPDAQDGFDHHMSMATVRKSTARKTSARRKRTATISSPSDG